LGNKIKELKKPLRAMQRRDRTLVMQLRKTLDRSPRAVQMRSVRKSEAAMKEIKSQLQAALKVERPVCRRQKLLRPEATKAC
jgi:hypothetical protein